MNQYEYYIEKNKERVFTASSNNSDNISKNRTITKTRKQKWEEKQLYGYFKWQTCEVSHGKTRARLQMGILVKETESLLTAAQNNAIRTNYIKAKINNTLQNCKWLQIRNCLY